MERLPRSFHRHPIAERRRLLAEALGPSLQSNMEPSGSPTDTLDLADAMVESAVGWMSVPLGLATGLVIDGKEWTVPMSVEEPSVIAAASYAGRIVARADGFETWSTDPVMAAGVFVENVDETGAERLSEADARIMEAVNHRLERMVRRGGGCRRVQTFRLDIPGMVRVQIDVDTRDAMGANALNTAAEGVRGLVEEISGGTVLMAILSNAAERRLAGARFRMPEASLSALGAAEMSGRERCRRIALASEVAQVDRGRAVTHNKGVMNAITSLALATGNDTRALEAGVHAWASRSGSYRGVSTFTFAAGELCGEIEVPMQLATVGGSIGMHPTAALALEVLGNPDARILGRIAAAVGLAQNFAALLALTGAGIQKGHMRLHAARIAYQAGARGSQVRAVAEILAADGNFSPERARSALADMDSAPPTESPE